MYFLLDANFAYIALVVGFLMALLAIITPGTGFFEIITLFLLFFAGYGMYRLPVNPWAIVLILLALVPYLFGVRKKGLWYYFLATFILLTIGSIFLFHQPDSWKPAVNPILAIIVILFTGGFISLVIRKVIIAQTNQTAHSLTKLIGMVVEARTDIYNDGEVYANGETWTAYSQVKIPSGKQVRIIRRDGLRVEVEPVVES